MAVKLSHPFDADTDITLGGVDGQVKLVCYIDYTSRASRQVRTLLRRTVERFGPRHVSLAVRQAPSPQRQPDSDIASRAAVAAAAQEGFEAMHGALFEQTGPIDRKTVDTLAETLGLDMAQFEADLDAEQTVAKVAADRETARASDVRATPSLFIDGRRYLGAWDETNLLEALEKPTGLRIKLASLDFVNWAASSGLVLILATLAALVLANTGLHDTYETLRTARAGLTFGDHAFALPLATWVNDGLMTIFFLLIGIEIKRELLTGELSDPRRAALPILAAIGGMAMPAAVYAAINAGQPTLHGWGVPMATDIAFTLGLMALLGTRIPTSLKVFVSALAIADDLGAIVIIALFYGHGFNTLAFGGALAVCGVMILFNRFKIYARLPYLLAGIALWVLLYKSGIHATLAGVLVAAAIPARPHANPRGVAAQAATIFETDFREAGQTPRVGDRSFRLLRHAFGRLRDPGFHLEQQLQTWSSYAILPLFAFFNTGIAIFGSGVSLGTPASLGVIAGLVIGKPLGIVLTVWIAVRTGIAEIAPEIGWLHLVGAGCLAGIGFTMSIFIGTSAFDGDQLATVKLAILSGSVIAATLGMLLLGQAKPPGKTADAEAATTFR